MKGYRKKGEEERIEGKMKERRKGEREEKKTRDSLEQCLWFLTDQLIPSDISVLVTGLWANTLTS